MSSIMLPCALLFKKSIHNIKHSNNLFYRYKNAQKNNTKKKEEYAENESITLRKIKFNNIIFSPFFCLKNEKKYQ